MKMYNTNQQGVSAIAMVLILLLLGVLLLNNFNDILFSWRKQAVYERQYFQHYTLAASSLAWATQQHWPVPMAEWFCLEEKNEQLKACIKQASLAGFILLSGQSPSLTLYSLGIFDPLAGHENLTIRKGYWLDFCPEKADYSCD